MGRRAPDTAGGQGRFLSPAREELVRRLLRQKGVNRRLPPAPRPVERGGELPLSYAQQRLWFLEQLEPGSPRYNLPLGLRLEGELEVGDLEWALNQVVARHEVLRTVFPSEGGRPRQEVRGELRLELEQEAVGGEEELRRRLREEARRSFDLERGPLLRARLLVEGAGRWVLLLTLHHIVADGWSMGVLLGELGELYGSRREGREAELRQLEVQYADYAVWQREWLEGGELERQLEYWRGRLEGLRVLELPGDRARPGVQSFGGEVERFLLGRELVEALEELSRRRGVTLYMTLLAGFQALLWRYTGESEVAVGTPVANRRWREVEGLVGFFVNTLVMRTEVGGEPSFEELLGRVREVALGAYEHQDLPFERLVEELQPERDLARNPLFQVLFQLQDVAPEPLRVPGLDARHLPVHN